MIGIQNGNFPYSWPALMLEEATEHLREMEVYNYDLS